MSPSDWLRAFHSAYDAPEQAIANLTTWLVFGTFFGALASVAVAITAFTVQARAFERERQRNTHRKAELGVSALQSAKAGLVVYDNAIGSKGSTPIDRKRSDIAGRMIVAADLCKYYLSLQIVDIGIVSTLIATISLLEKTLDDIGYRGTNTTDDLTATTLQAIYAHRTGLRDGVAAMIDKNFNAERQPEPY